MRNLPYCELAFQFTVDRRARYRREELDHLYFREEVELELHPISGPCLGTLSRTKIHQRDISYVLLRQ